jgi:putative intracellular protease/amidase
MKILMVITSHDTLGDSGEKTGFWLEEFASPYYVFTDAGATVTLASPQGGQPPLDPKSELADFLTDATARFNADSQARTLLGATLPLADIDASDFDAVFYPGGHGPLWDLYHDQASIALIEALYASGKPVATVCHAPAALLLTKAADGSPLVAGKRVTGFSNEEEEGVGLTQIVPYLLEDALVERGGQYQRGEAWSPYVVVDGNLITGQNPASSEATAQALLAQLR